MITIEEAKAAVGTEFVYELADGDSVRGYLKKFDPEIGCTCLTLETQTAKGLEPAPWASIEDDGTWCLVGADFRQQTGSLREVLSIIEEIIMTGRVRYRPVGGGPACAFS